MLSDLVASGVAATPAVQTKGINLDGSLTTATLVTGMVTAVLGMLYRFLIKPGMNNIVSANPDVSELKKGFETLTTTLAGLSLEMAERRGVEKGRAQVVAEQLKMKEEKE